VSLGYSQVRCVRQQRPHEGTGHPAYVFANRHAGVMASSGVTVWSYQIHIIPQEVTRDADSGARSIVYKYLEAVL
jgi:hypothetical protein